jgi:structure-specific endonuclease subunit SLX1
MMQNQLDPESLYCCYLLASKHPSYSNHAYIGFTNDPRRRLRQHNGEIEGGAKVALLSAACLKSSAFFVFFSFFFSLPFFVQRKRSANVPG